MAALFSSVKKVDGNRCGNVAPTRGARYLKKKAMHQRIGRYYSLRITRLGHTLARAKSQVGDSPEEGDGKPGHKRSTFEHVGVTLGAEKVLESRQFTPGMERMQR